jgi:hypothetical protein
MTKCINCIIRDQLPPNFTVHHPCSCEWPDTVSSGDASVEITVDSGATREQWEAAIYGADSNWLDEGGWSDPQWPDVIGDDETV